MIGDAALVDDRFLLERYARTRDAQAFRELAKRYAGLVYGTCLRVTQDPDDAEDVAQECFMELARRAGTINSSLGGWLHKVAKTRSINAIKSSGARRAREQQAFLDDTADTGPAWAEIAPYVDEAIEALPDNLRIPTILHYFHGLSQSQIAGQLSLSQPTVSRQLDKAVALLREELRKAGIVAPVALLSVLLAEKAVTAAPATFAVALGKMAISGVGGSAAVPHAGGFAAHTAARQALGTLAGKVVVGAVAVGIVVSIAYVANTLAMASASAPAPRNPAPVVVVAAPVSAKQAVKAEVTAQPQEGYRSDPFTPSGYTGPTKAVHRVKAPIADLPMPRVPRGATAGPDGGAPKPEPVQPVRRMAGLVQNGGLFAIIETGGKTEIVQPGEMLSDKLAVVERIEQDRVVLKTVGRNPSDVTVRLTPAPGAGNRVQPPAVNSGPRPGVMLPGVPAMRRGAVPMVGLSTRRR